MRRPFGLPCGARDRREARKTRPTGSNMRASFSACPCAPQLRTGAPGPTPPTPPTTRFARAGLSPTNLIPARNSDVISPETLRRALRREAFTRCVRDARVGAVGGGPRRAAREGAADHREEPAAPTRAARPVGARAVGMNGPRTKKPPEGGFLLFALLAAHPFQTAGPDARSRGPGRVPEDVRRRRWPRL